MVLEYFSLKRGEKKSRASGDDDTKNPKQNAAKTPVLDEAEEKFLRDLADEGDPPPLPARPTAAAQPSMMQGKDAQIALMDGADSIALPTSPAADVDSAPITPQDTKADTTDAEQKKKNRLSSYFTTLGRSASVFGKGKGKGKEEEGAATSSTSTVQQSAAEKEKETDDLAGILDQLNLSAANNRVFSFSKESEKLLNDFKIVLKDLVNGVPTAYDDLEKLLKNSEGQLEKMFEGMPPFLRTLIKQLPSKMTAALGPEILAAAAEKPGADGSHLKPEGKGTKKARGQIPTLKSLLSQQGAIATMLRSILNFLKLRFPVLMTGTNVLLSLAVFILLFVFWYCHKRGKETRIEKEKSSASTDVSDSEMEDSIILTPTNYYEESTRNAAAVGTTAGADRSLDAAAAGSDPAVERMIENFPTVLDLPDPVSVPLPNATTEDETLKEPTLKV